MTRTRRNYTVCLPKRRICFEYESAAAPLRDKGILRPESFRRSSFYSNRRCTPSVPRNYPLPPRGLYFTCTRNIDPSAVIRGSSKSIGPEGGFAIDGRMRERERERRSPSTSGEFVSSVAQISDAQAILHPKKSCTSRKRPRNRNIHPRGRRTGLRRAITRLLSFTGGPCGSWLFSSCFLPPPRSHSISSSLLFILFLSLPCFFSFLFFSPSHRYGRDTYASLFRIPRTKHKFSSPSSPFSILTFGYAGRLLPWPPSPSLSLTGSFLFFHSHLRAIRSGEAPDGSRENTAYRRSYSAQSF